MNFFEQQDNARKRTGVLLFFYGVAVIATILSVYVVTRVAWFLMRSYAASRSRASQTPAVSFDFWDPDSFWVVLIIVVAVVALGTFFKIKQLSSGGAAVAKMLGGEQILPNTKDPDERRVLNVVEEMSIAAGVPVPLVFILKNENGINAFAAGFSTQDMVIGVTRGTVKLLSRDELQGVIAHEFSHIFNGDMRLNMHLTGFLNGLLLIALTGKTILRGFRYGGRVRSSGRGGGAAILVVLVFAFLLMIVGYIGVLFCNWIKSCVSRQREFLADASSVQYTRNPGGLAGALKKIGGLTEGAFVYQPKAEETSHFFFANAINLSSRAMFQTHPPLDLRIKLLDPSFDGKFPVVKSIAPRSASKHQGRRDTSKLNKKAKKVEAWEKKVGAFRIPGTEALPIPTPNSFLGTVGTVTAAGIVHAAETLNQIPKQLKELTSTLSGAVALCYGLLIDRANTTIRTRQLEYLKQNMDPAIHPVLLKLLPDLSSLPIEAHLPLMDLLTPALKTQSPEMYERFKQNITALIDMDETVTVFEFVLKQVILHHLDFFFGKRSKPVATHTAVAPIAASCEVLLSYLAAAGHLTQPLAQISFMKAAKELMAKREWRFIPPTQLPQQQVEDALRQMACAVPRVKERFLKACVSCVEEDGRLRPREIELLRAFASTLDCPIPPFSAASKT